MLNSLVERQRGLKDRLLSKKLGAKANYECRTFRYIFFAVTARKAESDVNVSITTFHGGQKHIKNNFPFCFRSWVAASRIQPWENSPTFHVKIERVGMITTN